MLNKYGMVKVISYILIFDAHPCLKDIALALAYQGLQCKDLRAKSDNESNVLNTPRGESNVVHLTRLHVYLQPERLQF